MATPLNIDIAINTAESAQSLTDLRKSLKDLISAQSLVGTSGSDQFKKLQNAINDTEGKIGDLNDSFNTLKGSGLDRVNSSIGLFKEGLTSADPGKLTLGLQGLKAAMAAIPIFLIIEGLKLLWENFDKVKEVIFGTTNEVENNKNALKALQAQQDATSKSLEDYIKVLEKEYDTLTITDGSLDKRLDLRKKITAAQIESVDVLIIAKEKEIKATEELIETDLRALEVQQLQSAGNAASALSYDAAAAAATRALNEKLETQKKELAAIRALRADRENIEAQGAASLKKVRDDAAKKELEDWQKRQDALDKLVADSVKKKQKALEFEQGGESEIIRNGNKKKVEALSEYQTTEELLLTQSAQRTSNLLDNAFRIERADLKNSLDGRIQLLTEQKEKEIALVEEGSNAALIIEKNYNQAVLTEKTKAAQQQLTVVQSYANALSGVNQLISQSQNQNLEDQKVAKDQSLVNDDYRNQVSLKNTQVYYENLLANQNLSEEERTQIQTDYENARQEIEYQGKLNQSQITQEFNKKQDEVNKEQFERNKKLQIVMGIVNTAAAVLSASTLQPYPVAVAAMIAAGIAGAAQIATITNSRYQSTNAVSVPPPLRPAPISAPSVGGNGGSGTPGSTVNGTQFDPTNIQNAQGNRDTRVYVLESDITDAQGKIKVNEGRANFRY